MNRVHFKTGLLFLQISVRIGCVGYRLVRRWVVMITDQCSAALPWIQKSVRLCCYACRYVRGWVVMNTEQINARLVCHEHSSV